MTLSSFSPSRRRSCFLAVSVREKWPLAIGRRGNRLLVNDGTASFAEAADAGLATDRSGRRALFSDFDNDRDVDFLLLGELGSPNSGIELYLNNRDGTFSDMAVSTGLGQGGEAIDISAGDFRPDGYIDLLALGADGALTLTVTFALGTDPDKAQQLVQNRVSQATTSRNTIGRAILRSAPSSGLLRVLTPICRGWLTHSHAFTTPRISSGKAGHKATASR